MNRCLKVTRPPCFRSLVISTYMASVQRTRGQRLAHHGYMYRFCILVTPQGNKNRRKNQGTTGENYNQGTKTCLLDEVPFILSEHICALDYWLVMCAECNQQLACLTSMQPSLHVRRVGAKMRNQGLNEVKQHFLTNKLAAVDDGWTGQPSRLNPISVVLVEYELQVELFKQNDENMATKSRVEQPAGRKTKGHHLWSAGSSGWLDPRGHACQSLMWQHIAHSFIPRMSAVFEARQMIQRCSWDYML